MFIHRKEHSEEQNYISDTFREYWMLNLYEIFDLRFLNKMNQIDVQLQSKSILLSRIVYHNVSSE